MASFNVIIAIRFTPYFARTAGWDFHFREVCGVLGFKSHYPEPKDFVKAVYKWQSKHPPLKADGILGPRTWWRMKSKVKAYVKDDSFMGPHSKWVQQIITDDKSPASSNKPEPVQPKLEDDESRVIQEMASVALKQKSDMYLAVPVSGAYAADQGYPRGVLKDDTGLPLTQTLEVGQKWGGIAGDRIVLGLSGGGSFGSVIFITEGGQAYDQRVKGWESDMFAKHYSDVSKKLAPIKLLLDIEAAFLLGAISASSGLGAVVVLGGSATKFVLENRELLKKIILAIPVVLAVRKALKEIAPTLYDALISTLISKLLSSIPIPDSITDDPKALARFVGEMIVKVGKMVLLRDFKSVSGIIGILISVLKTLRSSGSTMSFDRKQLVEDLKQMGASVSKEDAQKIFQEIQQNPDKIKDLLEQLRAALDV